MVASVAGSGNLNKFNNLLHYILHIHFSNNKFRISRISLWQIVSTARKVCRRPWHLSDFANLNNESHSNRNVPVEVAVKKPIAWIVCTKAQSNIAGIGKHNGVLVGWKSELFVSYRRFHLVDSHVCSKQTGIDYVEL